MDPVTMMMIAQAAPAVINLVKSGVQGLQANRLSKQGRPQYNIPQEAINALELSKYMAAQNELPGQSIMEERIGRNTAGAIDNLKQVSTSPVALGGNIANIYRGQLDAINDLNIKAAQNELNQDQNLIGAYNNFAQYRDKAYNYNQYEPYVRNKMAESALRSGSFNNLATGVQGLGNAASSGAMADYYGDLLKDLNNPVPFNYGNNTVSPYKQYGIDAAMGGVYGGMGSAYTNPTVVDNTVPTISSSDYDDMMKRWQSFTPSNTRRNPYTF